MDYCKELKQYKYASKESSSKEFKNMHGKLIVD